MAIITITLSDADIYREGADNVERAIEVALRNISVSVNDIETEMEEQLMANINVLAPFILSWEGGYVNHPSDKGGATKYGVTLKKRN